MERDYTVVLATCPKYKAVCEEGHDEDGQIFCACCGHSYIPSEVTKVTEGEYKEICKNATQTYTRGGWKAYKHSN